MLIKLYTSVALTLNAIGLLSAPSWRILQRTRACPR